MAKNIVTLKLDDVDYTARPYAVCDTAGNVKDKVANCTDFNLTTGATILVKFSNDNTSTDTLTLNINGTGAKNIVCSNRHKFLSKDIYYEFLYNGTNYIMMTDNDFLSLDGGQLDGNIYIPNPDNYIQIGDVETTDSVAKISVDNFTLKSDGRFIEESINGGTVAKISLGSCNSDTREELIKLEVDGSNTAIADIGNINIKSNEGICPNTPGLCLGSADKIWEALHCNNMYGELHGNAASADKLNTDAGSTTKPVYFANGIPVQCNDSLDVDITGNADTATNADASDKLNTDAGSTTKPVYFSGGVPVQCNDSLDVDITGNSDSSDKLNTNAGSTTKPVYFANGVPVQCNDSLGVNITGKSDSSDKLNTNAGSTTKPVYFSGGVPVQCNDSLDVDITGNADTATNADSSDKLNTNAGSTTKPVYFSGGVPVQCNDSLDVSITGKSDSSDKLNTNAGSTTKPVYFSNGVPVQCNDSLDVNISKNAATASKLNTNAGSTVKPVYFSNGVPVQCNDSLDVNISKNAATASKLLTNAGNISIPVYFSNGVPVACDLDINDTYEVTYNNLMNLKNGGKLAPGKKYRIIDYAAVASSRKSWMTVVGNKFDIILEAINTITLSENAKAIHAKYPSGTSSNILDFTMQLSNWTNPSDTGNSWWTEIKNDIQKLAPNIYTGVTDDSLGEAKFSGKSFSKGKATVTFQYQSGLKDVHCLGVVVLNGNQIIAKDIHIVTTGYAHNNNVYSLDIPTAGSYQIRMYVDKWRRSAGENRNDMDAACKLTVNHIDDYFANCDLNAWDIKYCADYMQERFQWAPIPTDNAGYKGIIYYMKDEFGNEANYDFKNIKMDGYYTFDYNGKDGSVATNRVWNNKIALQPNLLNFNLDLPKCYFKNTDSNFICANNTIGPNCQNIIFGNSCDSNTIRNYCENITMGNSSSYNDIDTFCKNITTDNYFQSNTIGKNCETITCGKYFVRNKIGNKVSSLNFYKSSSGTTKLDGVHGFVIGDRSNSLTIRCTSSSDFNSNTGNYVQYFNIPQNSTGTITISDRSQSETTICVKESSGIKQYKLVDAFGVKVEDATNAEIDALF